jgi:hypothetical protein
VALGFSLRFLRFLPDFFRRLNYRMLVAKRWRAPLWSTAVAQSMQVAQSSSNFCLGESVIHWRKVQVTTLPQLTIVRYAAKSAHARQQSSITVFSDGWKPR